ncbi:MAG: elongation factor P [Gemmatimonadales bacterium]
MATTADIHNGLVLDLDGHLMQVTYFQHVKPGKGSAFVRTRLRNVRTGAVLERTFPSGERLDTVELTHRPMSYSYRDGDDYHFMDLQSFDDVPLSGDLIGADQLKYLKEGIECTGLVRDEEVLLVELPQFVELEIVETDPGKRGDAVAGATKPARLETGAVVQVPLFVEQGTTIRVDRRQDKYLARV